VTELKELNTDID